jgi:lysozyme
MGGKMAALAIIFGGAVALFLIAKYEGVDVGQFASEELGNLSDEINAEVASAGASLGLSSDPIAIALPIIKTFEGFSATAYPDPPGSGKYSIGYGHQIRPGDPYDANSTIGEDEAADLLRVDVGDAYADVQNRVAVELNPNQTAALISLRFNIGGGAFASSTLLRLVNQGDFDDAAAQFPVWIHSGGAVSQALVTRRAQEQELFTA